MKKIVLLGASGHCKVIIDIIKSKNEYEIVGITNKNSDVKYVLNIPIIGEDSKLKEIYDSGVHNAFICVGAIGNMDYRNLLYKELKLIGFNLPILIHKESIVSKFAHIDEGTCVMPGAIINTDSYIGKNCIINTGAVIEHDCKIGNNTHISPSVSIAGGVNVGFNTHVGIGSSIIQGISIGNNVTVGAGAVVINNLNDNALAVGVPAKVIKTKDSI